MTQQVLARRAPAYLLLNERIASVEAALPSVVSLDAKQYCATALEIAGSRDLENCTPLSVVRAIFGAAKLGLSLNKTLGQAFIVPRKIKGTPMACLQVGYLGWLELTYRSKRIAAVHAEVVFENDEFDEQLGSDRKLIHRRWDIIGASSSGALRLAYCSWYDVLSKKQEFHRVSIDRIKRARNTAQTDMIWKADEVAMWKKTAIHDAHRLWPLTPELALAGRIEDQAERDEQQDLPKVEGEPNEAPAEQKSELDDYTDPAPPSQPPTTGVSPDAPIASIPPISNGVEAAGVTEAELDSHQQMDEPDVPEHLQSWDATVDAIKAIVKERGKSESDMHLALIGFLIRCKPPKKNKANDTTVQEREQIYKAAVDGRGVFAFLDVEEPATT